MSSRALRTGWDAAANGHHHAGRRPAYAWDDRGLTFIISSWRCDWASAVFDAAPLAIDHGALTPVVANFTPRPGGDGIDVWTAGPRPAVEAFATALLGHPPQGPGGNGEDVGSSI